MKIARTNNPKCWACVLLAAWMTLAISITGCSSTPTDPIAAKYDSARSYPKISLTNPSLYDAIGVQPTIETKSPGNLMQLTLPIRATSPEELHIEYRVIWFDAQQRPISPQMTWAPKRLSPRQPDHIVASASSDTAVDYNIQLRWSRP